MSFGCQGCEQCGAQVCAQTHGSGAGSKDYWDHSREDDCPTARGGENLHAKGDPSPQLGEGTPLNQYVGILLNSPLYLNIQYCVNHFVCLYVPLVTLIDSYESTTFIFLVFDLWVWSQIENYWVFF